MRDVILNGATTGAFYGASGASVVFAWGSTGYHILSRLYIGFDASMVWGVHAGNEFAGASISVSAYISY